MTVPPKFLVRLVNGRVVITPSDCTEATEAQVDWVRNLITRDLRSQNFVNGPSKLDPPEIDPLVSQLDEARKRKGVSITVLAEAAFMAPNRVGEYFNGRISPTVATLRTLASVLGITFGEAHESLVPTQRSVLCFACSTDQCKSCTGCACANDAHLMYVSQKQQSTNL